MTTAVARIETSRPERYLAQICKHAAAIGGGGHRARMHRHSQVETDDVNVGAEWSEDRGTVTFTPGGTCSIAAKGDLLTLRIDADDEDSLRRIQDILARDLDRFGRRDRLVVNWQDSE